MTAALAHLNTGDLQRLQAALQSDALSLANAAAGLLRYQIAGDDPQLRSRVTESLAGWAAQGGTAMTLALAVEGILAQRRLLESRTSELVWSGPAVGTGDTTRNQAIVIREMIERAQQRLLITTYNLWAQGFIRELLDLIQDRMQANPALDVRMVLNVPRPDGNSDPSETVLATFRRNRWQRIWASDRPRPQGFFDPRSLELNADLQAVFHVKTVVADRELLVTSANLSDNAQRLNCELGIHYPESDYADAVWQHFHQLIQRRMLVSLDEDI